MRCFKVNVIFFSYFRSTVIEAPEIWFKDEGNLTKVVCEDGKHLLNQLMMLYIDVTMPKRSRLNQLTVDNIRISVGFSPLQFTLPTTFRVKSNSWSTFRSVKCENMTKLVCHNWAHYLKLGMVN